MGESGNEGDIPPLNPRAEKEYRIAAGSSEPLTELNSVAKAGVEEALERAGAEDLRPQWRKDVEQAAENAGLQPPEEPKPVSKWSEIEGFLKHQMRKNEMEILKQELKAAEPLEVVSGQVDASDKKVNPLELNPANPSTKPIVVRVESRLGKNEGGQPPLTGSGSPSK